VSYAYALCPGGAGLRSVVPVALCHVTLRLPENGSLKGKRAVIKSIQQRLHNRFNVSVAEVDHNDAWQLAGIEIAAVANTGAHASEVVANAVAYMQALRLDVEVLEEETEVVG
jgi:uncharacterized protein YlxP (DUF503 family)